MAESSTSSDTMQVGLSVLREIKVDDNIHGLNINTSRKDVCTHQAPRFTVFEIMENPKFI